MPYINIETRLKRTWAERLFSWPWRPWQSHIVTVRREKIEKPRVYLNDPRVASIIAEQKARMKRDEAKRSSQVPPARNPAPAAHTTHIDDPVLMRHFPHASHYDELVRDDHSPTPIVSGQGGDFGGGGASSSWSDTSSCDSSSSSSDSGSSCDSSSSSSD